MKQKSLLVLVGPPGCGKSTWAKKYIKSNPNGLYVSRDEVRYSFISDDDTYFAKEDEVFDTFCMRIGEGLVWKDCDYIIADATHLNQMGRHKLLNEVAPSADTKLIAVVFDTPLNECIKRNNQREGRKCVPLSVLRRMFYSKTDPAKDQLQTFSEVWHVNEKGEIV